MDVETMRLLATAIAVGAGVLAPGFAVGLIGAAAAWAAKCVISNTLVRSLAERLLFPLLGLGVAGSILGIFLNWQNKQIKNPENEFF